MSGSRLPKISAVDQEIKGRFMLAMRHIILLENQYHIRSRKAFAETIDWTANNLSRAEKNNNVGVPPKYLHAICTSFGVNGHWLLTGTGDMWADKQKLKQN